MLTPSTARTTVLLLLFSFIVKTVFAAIPPPGNDECVNAIPLTLGITDNGGTVKSATPSAGIPTGCATGNPDDDVWYTFTLSSTTSVTITLSSIGSNLNSSGAMIQVFSGSCGSPNSVACGNTEVTATSLVSGTYYIRVYSFGSTSLNSGATFSITVAGPPSNNDCSDAIILSNGVTNSSGTVWLATASSSIPTGCATGDPDDDVWYKFTASATSLTVDLTSIGSNLSSSGAMIQLFSGTCGSLASVACGTTSLITTVTNGSTYYLRVYSSGTGSIGGASSGSIFSITVTTTTPPTPPGNDECANAYLVPTSVSCTNSRGTITGATASAGVPIGACTGNPDDDVWYKFVAQKTNPTITLSNIGINLSSSGSRLQLLSGACGSYTSLGCGTTSITASGLTAGTTYYIRVYSNGSTQLTSNADFDICVADPAPVIVTDSTTALFSIDTVARQLGYPWELTYGPDDSLWITEARGYRVLRMSASRTGSQKNIAPQQILKIPLGSSLVSFDRSVGTWPQGGLEGLAIHPEFMTNPSKRWVYIAYVYSGACPASASSPCIFRSKIVRCQFYFAADAGNPSFPLKDTLVILDTVISNLSGSNDHNSGRLKIGPVTEGSGTPTYKLYYTIGDMGAGQFNNTTRTNYAQTPDTCEGKILRLNTEPDGDVSFGITHDFNTWRQWIPNDNPFTHSINGLRTPVYTYGHRNAQGLVWGNVNGTWRLYSCEHGDRSDDEINILEAGKNYGWPKVTGMADNNYTTADDISDGFTLNNILANQTVVDELTFANSTPNYKNPMFAFLNWSPAQIETINTGNIFTWPTIAPSSVDFYNGGIPGWKNSLLVASLKYGMFRLKLNAAGDAVDSTVCTNTVDTFPLLHSWRVRDIAINPVATSGVFWVVIDSSGSTSGPTGGFNGGNSNTKDGGKVLKLTYKTLITLPVHFISFSGKLLADETVRLDWVAYTDQHHNYFEVEKSTNSTSFTSIGKVAGGSPYYFIDPLPNMGNNYYRIKQADLDGTVTYSKVINIIYDPNIFTITVYPNPIRETMNIKMEVPQSGNIHIQVTDMQGRIVYKQNRFVDKGTAEISLDAKTWPAQLFILKVTGNNNEVLSTQKIMKL
jgi:trimeric autotransporter adhesin